MSGAEETFAGRWSRRKRAVATETDTSPDTVPVHAAGALPVDIAGEATAETAIAPTFGFDSSLIDADSSNAAQADETALTDADMPPIESLNADSDISSFFSQGVSAALRQTALRRIFSMPVYNVRDGLNDYDGDYTVFEPLGDTVTSDMKFHAARKERERMLALEEEQEQEAAERASAAEERVNSQEQAANDEETSADELPDNTTDEAIGHESELLEASPDAKTVIQADVQEQIEKSGELTSGELVESPCIDTNKPPAKDTDHV